MQEETYLTSGCTLLNLMVSGSPDKAYIFGKIHNIFGVEGSGKSYLSLLACKNAFEQFQNDSYIVYDDSERALNMNIVDLTFPELFEASDKVDDSSNVVLLHSKTIEDFFENLNQLAERKQSYKVYVLDSYDALWSKDSKEDGYQTEKVRKFSFLAGKIFNLCYEANILLILINQIRQDIGGVIKTYRTTGGFIGRHAPSLRLQLHPSEKFTKKGHGTDIVFMQKFDFQVIKSRFGKPFRRGSYYLNFYNGKIDNELTNIMYLVATGKISKDKKTKKLTYDEKHFSPLELARYIRQNNKQEEILKMLLETFEAEEKRLQSLCDF